MARRTYSRRRTSFRRMARRPSYRRPRYSTRRRTVRRSIRRPFRLGANRAEVKIRDSWTRTNPVNNVTSEASIERPGQLEIDFGPAFPVGGSYGNSHFNYVGTHLPWLLTGVAAGAGFNERIGKAIYAKSITLRFSVTPVRLQHTPVVPPAPSEIQDSEGSADDTSRFVRTNYRFVVFRDMEGTQDTTSNKWDDIFQSTVQAGGTTRPSIHDFMNVDAALRFKIVADKRITVDQDDPTKQVSISIPMGHQLRYTGSHSFMIRTGHYWIIAAYEVPNLRIIVPEGQTFFPPEYNVSYRFLYTDS